MAYLEAGPAASGPLVRDVLGLVRTPRATADQLVTTLLGGDPRVTRTADGRWTLAGGAGDPPLDACRFAVVDIEATGASARLGGRIIEIAVATLDGGEARVVFETLVRPERPIPPLVARLTGITDAAVRHAPPFTAIADELLGALAGAVFVAHNVAFDWGFIAAELERTRALLLAGPRLCTLRLARRLFPPLESRTLDALAHYCGFEIAGRHRAGPDALAAARILARLLARAREHGAVTLHDLVTRMGRPARPACVAPGPRRPADPSA